MHGGWARYDGDHLGSVNFASKTGDYFRDNIQFPFFEKYLKGEGDAEFPKAYVFETGTNVWRKYSAGLRRMPSPRLSTSRPRADCRSSPGSRLCIVRRIRERSRQPVPFVNYTA